MHISCMYSYSYIHKLILQVSSISVPPYSQFERESIVLYLLYCFIQFNQIHNLENTFSKNKEKNLFCIKLAKIGMM